MTALESNLASIQRWYGTYLGRGLDPARDLIDEIFDPQVEFSPWLAHDEALRAAREVQRA
jgi:hypothetical protein